MHRISVRITAGLAACLAAATIAGCATAPAAGKPAQTPAAPATSTGAPAGCLRTTTITLAGNGKTYCFRVGQKLDVFLRGTLARMWQEPRSAVTSCAESRTARCRWLRGSPAPRTPPSGPGAQC